MTNETSEPAPLATSGGEHAYRLAGVDYTALDANKRLALGAALTTSGLLAERGGRALDASRGEPAFVFETGAQTLALVLEGLGTKSIIARAVAESAGAPSAGAKGFHAVAYDTVAAIVNDLCCVGARPLVVNAYFASGRPDWFSHGEWYEQLVAGWQRACLDAGCVWGGGESPSLPGLVRAEHIELAGSAVGVVPPGTEPVLGERLADGDEIVLVASSGLHANGASLARRVADELPKGYGTPLAGGQTLGEALLRPSHIYSRLVESLLDARTPVTYLSHITGHGLLKLMRPARELTYRIRRLPEAPEVLAFLAERAGMGARAAYSTFNMGCGFAVYCARGSGDAVVDLAARAGFAAIRAGSVETGPRRVILEPLGVEFADEELQLAPDR